MNTSIPTTTVRPVCTSRDRRCPCRRGRTHSHSHLSSSSSSNNNKIILLLRFLTFQILFTTPLPGFFFLFFFLSHHGRESHLGCGVVVVVHGAEIVITNSQEWIRLQENDTLPAGVHVRMDLSTGEKWVKGIIQDDDDENHSFQTPEKENHLPMENHPSSMSIVSPTITATEKTLTQKQRQSQRQKQKESIATLNDFTNDRHEKEEADYMTMYRTLLTLPMEEQERMGGIPTVPSDIPWTNNRTTTDFSSSLTQEQELFIQRIREIWSQRQEELKHVQEELLADVPTWLQEQIQVIQDYFDHPSLALLSLLPRQNQIPNQKEMEIVQESEEKKPNILTTLAELEFQLNDLDMARDFHTLGGWTLLHWLLIDSTHDGFDSVDGYQHWNATHDILSTDESSSILSSQSIPTLELQKIVWEIQSYTCWILGSAVKNIQEFHSWAMESISSFHCFQKEMEYRPPMIHCEPIRSGLETDIHGTATTTTTVTDTMTDTVTDSVLDTTTSTSTTTSTTNVTNHHHHKNMHMTLLTTLLSKFQSHLSSLPMIQELDKEQHDNMNTAHFTFYYSLQVTFLKKKLKEIYALGSILRGSKQAQKHFMDLDGPWILLYSIDSNLSYLSSSSAVSSSNPMIQKLLLQFVFKVIDLIKDLIHEFKVHPEHQKNNITFQTNPSPLQYDSTNSAHKDNNSDTSTSDENILQSFVTWNLCTLPYRLLSHPLNESHQIRVFKLWLSIIDYCPRTNGEEVSWIESSSKALAESDQEEENSVGMEVSRKIVEIKSLQ